ncbi:MAG TPA: dihydroorotate dehydrogenase-like protein [Solirubrobacteraceae bacterium]|nr:dihydroorotate dehydrogenase-like protein [Solirubrobacteraceae bacterium]
MTDLATRYMGLELRNPLVASPSPLSYTLDGIRHLAASGVGAVVMYSLFEEELREQAANVARLVEGPAESFPEALDYVPEIVKEDPGNRYLSLLEQAAGSVDVPVMASLNGITAEGWTGHARDLQEAGAAAIELNVYSLPDASRVSGYEAEQRLFEVLRRVKDAVNVPVAVKLSPYFSSFASFALALDAEGADALVLFNRFLGPDIDPEALAVTGNVVLSVPAEGRLPRAWIALLHRRLRASLAGTGGVTEPTDIARYLLAGADVVMSTSALLRHSADYARELLEGFELWMDRHEFRSVDELRGLLAVPADEDQAAYARSGYVKAIRAANATSPEAW